MFEWWRKNSDWRGPQRSSASLFTNPALAKSRQTDRQNFGTERDSLCLNTAGHSNSMCSPLLSSPKSPPHWSHSLTMMRFTTTDVKISFTLNRQFFCRRTSRLRGVKKKNLILSALPRKLLCFELAGFICVQHA